MKVLAFSGYYLPGFKGGGPIKTLKNLFDTTGSEIAFDIITSDRDLGDNSPYGTIIPGVWNQLELANIFYVQPKLKGFKQIFDIVSSKEYDIFYLNSFFSLKFSILPLILSKVLNQQVVLGPRGEFSESALKLKTKKKTVFIKLYKLLGLSQDVVFQASSKYEAEDIKRVLGSDVDIIIAEDIGSQNFITNITSREQTMKAVFLSRISPMKNLAFALEVLKKVKNELNYDIYGPIEDEAYWNKCLNIIADLPSNISVRYKGEVKPENVISVLSKYDLFFLPTQGENYGHVIAEALCAGLPLLISDATPWRNLESIGIGWDLPLGSLDKFSKVIDEIIEMSDDQHYKIRENALSWAKQKFAQRDAIDSNIAMFRYAYNKERNK